MVERHLTYTVDGVVGVIDNLWHTVLCSLHHHSATEYAAEVSTLEGVHQTTSIDRAYTILFPVSWVRIFLTRCCISKKEIDTAVLDAFKQRQQVINGQSGGLAAAGLSVIVRTVLIRTLLDTFIFQLIVISLACRKCVELLDCNFFGNVIVVGTIVGNVQSTIAIYEREVTITVQSTKVSCSQGNQVAVIYIVDRCCSITKYRCGVGIHGRRTRRCITTSEYGVEDGNAGVIQTTPSRVLLVAQVVKIFCSYIFTCGIAAIIDCNVRLCPTVRFNQHLAVLGKHILAIIHNPFGVILVIDIIGWYVRFVSPWGDIFFQIISVIITLIFVVVAFTILDADIELTVLFVGTIYITDITATEDVAVLAYQLLRCTYRTTMYIYLCLSEYVTVRVERTALTEVVISAAATEYIAVYVAFKEFY